MEGRSELIIKARQHAQRKYTIAVEKLAKASNEQLVERKAEMAAKGIVMSGSMWKIASDIYTKLIEETIQTKLAALLDAYELYQIPIDDTIEIQVLQDVTDLRETQINQVNQAISMQPVFRAGATYISGALSMIPNPFNAVKIEIEERRQRSKARHEAVGSLTNDPLIFVSCGQSTAAERKLGQEIAELVEELTGCRAYFAQNQTTLEGVTENILKRLNEAVGFIAIMHPRGNVSNPSARDGWVRGSVWVEQEIAIAAFMAQALQHPMQVRVFVNESIRREGLREQLHLNPTIFHNDAEILKDLRGNLPAWRVLAQQQRKELLSLKPNIRHRRVAVPGGGNDERYQLLINVTNNGENEAVDFRLDVQFPTLFLDESGHIARKGTSPEGLALFEVKNTDFGIAHLYPDTQSPDLLTFHYAVREKIKRENPELLQQRVTATVYSGNMKPRAVSKKILELMS